MIKKKRKRPWYIRLLYPNVDHNYVPHEHDELFLFHEYGISWHKQLMKTMMFFESVLIASLIVNLVMFRNEERSV